LLERYSYYLLHRVGDNYRENHYTDNKKLIHKRIREELDKAKHIHTNLSQYVEYWLYGEIENMIRHLWSMCEDRNKRQREDLKKKYSIIKIDELLKKIYCLETKVLFLENPEKVEEYFKRENKEEEFILKNYIASELDC